MKTRDKTTWILKTICQVREKGGRRGVLQIIFAPLRLECGEKGLSCVPETREEAEEEGWGAISRVMLLFFARPSVLKVGTFFIYLFIYFLDVPPALLTSSLVYYFFFLGVGGCMMKTLLHDSPGWWCVCVYVSFTGLHACTSTGERLKCNTKNTTSVFLMRWQCGRWCVYVRCDNVCICF